MAGLPNVAFIDFHSGSLREVRLFLRAGPQGNREDREGGLRGPPSQVGLASVCPENTHLREKGPQPSPAPLVSPRRPQARLARCGIS